MMKYDAKGIFIVYIIVAVLLILMICLIYFFNIGDLLHSYDPKGTIAAYWGSTPPKGWVICDGNNGTPDLRGKFVYGGDTISQYLLSDYKDNTVEKYMIHLLNQIEGGNNLQTLTTKTLDTNILSLYKYNHIDDEDKNNFNKLIEQQITENMDDFINVNTGLFKNILLYKFSNKQQTVNEMLMNTETRLVSNPPSMITTGDVFLESNVEDVTKQVYQSENTYTSFIKNKIKNTAYTNSNKAKSNIDMTINTVSLNNNRIEVTFTTNVSKTLPTSNSSIVIVKKETSATYITNGKYLVNVVTIDVDTLDKNTFFTVFAIQQETPDEYIPVYDVFELDDANNINKYGLRYKIVYQTGELVNNEYILKPTLYKGVYILRDTELEEELNEINKEKRVFVIVLTATRKTNTFGSENTEKFTFDVSKMSVNKEMKLDVTKDIDEVESETYFHTYNTFYNIISTSVPVKDYEELSYSYFKSNNTYVIKDNYMYTSLQRLLYKNIVSTIGGSWNIYSVNHDTGVTSFKELMVRDDNTQIRIMSVDNTDPNNITINLNKEVSDTNIFYNFKYYPSTINLLPYITDNNNTDLYPPDNIGLKLVDIKANNKQKYTLRKDTQNTAGDILNNDDKEAFDILKKGGEFLLQLYENNQTDGNTLIDVLTFRTPLESGYTLFNPNYNGYKYPSNKSLNADMNLPPYVSMIFIMKT